MASPELSCTIRYRGEKRVAKFNQKVPIPSYLLAVAVGALQSREIGPRSLVWAEPELLDRAASDFSETESMLRVAEELAGPYVWGRYDILVLPPFFPWNGMENPCLTFVAPTLLSGDKANAFVIAHEIAHSWTGNLVTIKNMEHFWLNEGLDTFLHRKILGRLRGDLTRHFEHELWWTKTEESIQSNNINIFRNRLSSLVTNLTGVDPEKAITWVPYEKGSAFLWFLEEAVGGPDKFDPFLRSYIEEFANKSVDSEDFKSHFQKYFRSTTMKKKIRWRCWLYGRGLPAKPDFNTSLALEARRLAEAWQSWDLGKPLTFKEDFKRLTSSQQQEFLSTLLKSGPLPAAKGGLQKKKRMEFSTYWLFLFFPL